MIKLSGILGNNCGKIINYDSIDKRTLDAKRIQERGFKVEGGIESLRGYANIKDLASASTFDKGYQREKDQKHLKDIRNYLDKGRALSKFLPEVILVGDLNTIKLTPFLPTGKTTEKLKGEIKNLEYYSIEVEENSLKRIDGNHRLEAGANKDIYVPFAIILWPASDDSYQINRDNEAFLFHFLNGKAKRLTPEENFKGLVNSVSWTNDELRQVDPSLPYLKELTNILKENKHFNKKNFERGPLSQFAEIIGEIVDYSLSLSEFTELVNSSLFLLENQNNFKYLKNEFNHILPQLIYINFYHKNPPENIITISNWLQKYNYKKGSFESAKRLYEIAQHQIKIVHLKVFVAMPFWKNDINEVIKYNKIYRKALSYVVGDQNPHIKLELIPIMLRKGEAKRIDIEILNEIQECDIFMGDTTNNNLNVIFEIGFAIALEKPIIILRKESFKEPPPFDIDKFIYKNYDENNLEESIIQKIKINIPTILNDNFGLVLNKTSPAQKIKNQVNKTESTSTENKKELQRSEKEYLDIAKSKMNSLMNDATWDYNDKVIEFPLYGKIAFVYDYEQLVNTLIHQAQMESFEYIPGDNDEQNIVVNNTDWYGLATSELANYKAKLEELGWLK